eukprot:11315108-Karenia_brevis.AAC.1
MPPNEFQCDACSRNPKPITRHRSSAMTEIIASLSGYFPETEATGKSEDESEDEAEGEIDAESEVEEEPEAWTKGETEAESETMARSWTEASGTGEQDAEKKK